MVSAVEAALVEVALAVEKLAVAGVWVAEAEVVEMAEGGNVQGLACFEGSAAWVDADLDEAGEAVRTDRALDAEEESHAVHTESMGWRWEPDAATEVYIWASRTSVPSTSVPFQEPAKAQRMGEVQEYELHQTAGATVPPRQPPRSASPISPLPLVFSVLPPSLPFLESCAFHT